MNVDHGSRLRSVSATSTAGPQDEEIRPFVNALDDIDNESYDAFEASLDKSTCLQQLHHQLANGQENVQSAFRRANGFQALLGFYGVIAKILRTLEPSESQQKQLIFVLGQASAILAAALRSHGGNQKYFRTRLDGWTTLKSTLTEIVDAMFQRPQSQATLEHLFGILFATACGQEMLSDIYRDRAQQTITKDTGEASKAEVSAMHARSEVKKALSSQETLANPEVLPIMLTLWWSAALKDYRDALHLKLLLPASMIELLLLAARNLISAHTAGLLSLVLDSVLTGTADVSEARLYYDLALALCEEGIPDLNDTYKLFAKASTTRAAASFLLEAVRASRAPAHIQFDLSLCGYSAAELSSLGRIFPSPDTAGYSLMLWVRFDQFDPTAHTTVFGAFDPSQTCFILAYIEKDTHNFILQTSTKGSRPSVRFKCTRFEPGRWYHIAIVHRKPRTMASARALLYVDGRFMEQLKVNYPNAPPVNRSTGPARVQAFLGTPHDLAPNLHSNFSTSKWSLASAFLFQDVLSDDLIAVFYNLGARYHGNFQDCLGSFQTYQASAALNLRNENLYAGKEDKSEVILAIRQKASNLLPESTILLNISPAAILDSDDRNNIDESQLVKSLSKTAARNLQSYTRSGGNAIAINGAVPAINDALTQARGVATLTGDPAVAVPQSLEDAAWRMGGCAAIGVTLVHAAKSTEDLLLAVQIVFELITRSWRNSEMMERDNGYTMLVALMHDKLGSQGQNLTENARVEAVIPTARLSRADLTLELLKAVLAFVGFDLEHPENSMINNALAYRILLIDTTIWRSGPLAVQTLYFHQFVSFVTESQHHQFNLKRLTRMEVVKKLIRAMAAEVVSSTIMPDYMAAMKAVFPPAMNGEMLRKVSLFITYSVNKRSAPLQSRKSVRGDNRSRHSTGSSNSSTAEEVKNLTHFEIGVAMLRLYSNYLCAEHDKHRIAKFAKTVTNKWLLYLMSETSPEVVVLSTRILARLLVVHGAEYVKKFKEKSGGFTIMRHRLKRWWHIPALWPACFAVAFGVDIGSLNLDRSFNLFGLLDVFSVQTQIQVVYPEMFEVIMGMLQSGLKAIVHSKKPDASQGLHPESSDPASGSHQRLSMSTMAPPDPLLTIVAGHHVDTLTTVVRFLADLHARSQLFRDFAVKSNYVEELLHVLFHVVVGSDVVDAVVELNARDSALTFDGHDVVVQPLSTAPPIVRTTQADSSQPPKRGKHLRRGSSFVIVSAEDARKQSSLTRLQNSIASSSPIAPVPELNEGHQIVQAILELVISVFCDQILARKDFAGLGLFLRTPPGFVEHQSYFESWILRNTLSQLQNNVLLDQKLMSETKVLTNLARLFQHLGEALYEGWFIGGADAVLDLSGSVLEYLQRGDISKLKNVRLCAQSVSSIRGVVFRTVLLSLSQVEDSESLAFLDKLAYWQTVLLTADDVQSPYLPLVCYLLYASLISSQTEVRMAAANLWRIILVQKPEEAASILSHAKANEQRRLISSFQKVVELDNETFLLWIDEHRGDLDPLFFDTLSKSWDAFVTEENKRTEESARQRLSRRREKLKEWARDEAEWEETIRKHETSYDNWTSNIYNSEHLTLQRVAQDQQDDLNFTAENFGRLQRNVKRPIGFLRENLPRKWRLDQTEGRNRMRLRLTEDISKVQEAGEPRRKGSEAPKLRLDTRSLPQSSQETIGVTPGGDTPEVDSPGTIGNAAEPFPDLHANGEGGNEGLEGDESFEIIDNPNEGDDGYEDRNRKVMRSLHRGDKVAQVTNISRIVGLEAVEGLLILGHDRLYMIDNFFQRQDGEIVNAWQAPAEERDSYVRMISGRDLEVRKTLSRGEEHEARSWKWSDILSISKRRFLFRDVALELFFADGRSYLLTVISPAKRNDLYALVNAKTPQYSLSDALQSENAWRYEALRSPDDDTLSIGSKFARAFHQGTSMSATRKWQKGEMSNFHYLMLINTMAGRTYNDLTQYPVFPWVIADYTSEELDLTNPKSFRDLSKPMGCQTATREAEFRERYQTFAEMGDHNSPAFHYGTHYSSAMIVTSYLIRLQPFVKSYLLLQGGTFDHADRMFYSIQKTWLSASHQNMTDVRELTPEFYYLPEFLTNVNEYDFGTRQSSDESIGSVELPPWAKGDPKVFIAKQREALESPYVSQHLHRWIDLVFGFKQKGDAAVEAVNVFHHLSYQGAKDLDNIVDPVERLATIGIIHNFGQTPFQVFPRPHPAREEARHKYKRLDTAAESLTRLPSTLLDDGERVSSLTFSWKQERLLCSGAFRLNIPPIYDKYMEWGFSDNSVRFYSAESKKLLGHFEHLHVGQLSCAAFVDSKTLVTAGVDCTISIWNVVSSSKAVEIQPRASLFGHRRPITTLAVSRAFSTLVSASSGGEVFFWDLNRAEFVRTLDEPRQVNCAFMSDITGHVVLCHGSTISMYSINGALLLEQESGEKAGESMLCCACYEGVGSEWLERELVFTGHNRGVVKIWSKVVRDGRFGLDLVRQLSHADGSREDGGNVAAGISCILPLPQVVYTGDEDGRVYQWDCVQRH